MTSQHFIPPMYTGWAFRTDRNKKTARPIRALKEVRKQLQPRVVAIHDQLALAVVEVLGFDLREPCVLRAERGGCV